VLSIFFNSPRPPSSGSNQADLVRTHRPAPAPLESRDRRGAIIPLSRPSRAPRATSSRAESIAEPRREIRGEETPRDAREPDLVRAQPAGCYWWSRWPFDSTSKGRVSIPRLERSLAQPDANRVRVFRLARHRGYAPRGRALPRPQVRTRRRPPRVLDSPRLASSSPNPPRGVLSSTHAAPETRVICDRFANRGRSRVSPGAVSAGRHALTPLPISTPSTSSLTPACPSQPSCPENINCSWVRHARKRRGAVRGGPL
jgi:hypothetical protein